MSIGAGDIVLVTGATGFTGKHLVKELCKTGATVRAIVRKSSNLDEIKDLPVEFFIGDVYDEEVATKAAEGVNYIFHVAAAYREAKISDDIYWKVHVQSTHHLAKAVVNKPEFKRFIHVSTMGVHGRPQPRNTASRRAISTRRQRSKPSFGSESLPGPGVCRLPSCGPQPFTGRATVAC